MKNLIESTVWKERYKNTCVEIVRRMASESMRRAMGHKSEWFYYVYLYESYCSDFSALWLPSKLIKYSESGAEHITHDYNSLDIEMHGGMTYYAQHGQIAGHRTVQIGCDFQHLWDEGNEYSLEYVYRKAIECAGQCVEKFYKPELVEAK